MSISDKDKKLMKDVAAFFLATKSNSYPNGSINETALKFGITRTKVTKMLVTEGRRTLQQLLRCSEHRAGDGDVCKLQ